MNEVKVLVIDDERITRENIKYELEKLGFNVSTSNNGKEALSIIKNEEFDIVICDLIMPDLNGIEVLEEIKKITPDTEVIIITGHGSVKSAIECIKKGAIDYLVKPINTPELIVTIKKSIEEINLKKELKKTINNLKQTQQQLINSEKLSIIAKFATSIAHQLRNPLSVITSSSQYLIKKTSQDEQTRKILEIIKRNAEQAERIIKEVLSVAKPVPEEEFKEVSISEILDKVIESVYSKFYDANMSIVKNYKELPKIKGSAHHLEQAFLNFIMNSFDAMKENDKLTISAYKQNNELIIEFIDTGAGMNQEQLSKIFEPFFTTKKDGIGLGMFAAKKIIESHNGTIKIKSEVGKGTTIIVSLPL
jgi:signal transduction histidine kinase